MKPRRAFFFLLLAVAVQSSMLTSVAQTDTAKKQSKPKIGSTVFNWNDLAVKPNANGERRDVSDNPTATLAVFECHITTLNPGRASHAPHRHNQEELIIVKEGTLEVHINGQTQRASPGSVFFYASNDAHAVTNVGDARATYWVINLATAATHDLSKHNKASTRPSGVFDWDKLPVQVTKTGERRQVLQGSTVTMDSLSCHVTTVNVGEASHAAHRHPDDEIILVKEGTVEFTINGESKRAGVGSVVLFGSNDLHGMRNVGDTRAMYYVIRMVTAATPKAAPAAK
jgi:quercetin dioxygenase-like cupin family protein